jgi:exodeoxyribonuclease VII large subunit
MKDERSAIRCVMFASNRRGLDFLMQDGMKIVVKGSVNVYDRDGSYQVYATSIEKEGLGDLYEEYEKLKKRLSEQGMFDSEYKRPIPKYVKTIGVVTAETGAAVRDIINVSKRRNPGVQIVLYPAIVQGEEAPASIIAGIRALEEYGVDVMIVGRGGGSIEDLWGFNDEMVAHAIFNCDVPVISAVGHETDYTIADFVSDLRAPTPSAAAELANTDMMAVLSDLEDKKITMNRLIKNNLERNRRNLLLLKERLNKLSPQNKINQYKLRLDHLRSGLDSAMEGIIKDYKHKLSLMSETLNGLSPLAKLQGGFSYVADAGGKNIKSIKSINKDDALKVYVSDGVIESRVTGKEEIKWQKKSSQ